MKQAPDRFRMTGKIVFKTMRNPLACWPSGGKNPTVLEPGDIITVPTQIQRDDGQLAIIFDNKTLFCDQTKFWDSVW